MSDFLNSKPKRGLSQNFLTDQTISEKIASASEIQPDECVIEIGPGKGALTEKLLLRTSRLIAIEKDSALVPGLKERFPSLDIYEGDFISLSLSDILKGKLLKGEKAKIIANIPYHITTDILKQIIQYRAYLSSAVLMVQKEVAEKLHKPNLTDRSFSQTLIRSYAQIHFLFPVSRECFFPKPKVHSAVIKLDFQETRQIENDSFPDFLRNLFQKKRKQIFPLLSSSYPKEHVDLALQNARIAASARPMALEEKELIALFNSLTSLKKKSP